MNSDGKVVTVDLQFHPIGELFLQRQLTYSERNDTIYATPLVYRLLPVWDQKHVQKRRNELTPKYLKAFDERPRYKKS